MARLGRATPRRLRPRIRSAVRDPLGQWNTALVASRAGSGRARLMVMGDSQAEGQGASTRANRWQDVALTAVRSRLGLTGGGRGAVPAKYEVYGPDSPWGTTGIAVSGSVSDFAAGPFGQRGRIVGNASTLTWTVTGTHAQIWYGAYSGMSAFGYRVDGGSVVTVPATSPGTATWTPVAVTLGASGSHTVEIVTGAAESAYVGGLVVFDGDSTTGVTLLDAAKVGITADTYAGNAGEPHATSWERGVDSLAPDLVMIVLGLNDWVAQTAASAVVADLQAIVTKLRALAKVPSIIIVAPKNIAPDANTQPVTWNSYIAAYQNMVTTDGNLGFLNLDAAMAGTGVPGGTYWTTDWHPTDAGHAMIGDLVADVLVPAAGLAAGGAQGTWSYSGVGSGQRQTAGAGGGGWAFTGTAAGRASRSGAATGTVGWAGAGTGRAQRAGTATGGWGFAASAAGARHPAGAATGAWSWAGAATGRVTRRGVGSGSWVYASAATGDAPEVPPAAGSGSGSVAWAAVAISGTGRAGAGAGAVVFTGAAAGRRAPRATGAGAWQFQGVASGRRSASGTGTGQVSFTGAAVGRRAQQGTGVGSWGFTAAAAGSTIRQGTAGGGGFGDGPFGESPFGLGHGAVVAWVGVAAGTAPAVEAAEGSAAGGFTFGSSGVGYTLRQGRAGGGGFGESPFGESPFGIGDPAGTVHWTAAAAGHTPGLGGGASGAWLLAGVASGRRHPAGTGAGQVTWVGVAVTGAARTGTGAGSWSFTGAAAGRAPTRGTGGGAWSFTGVALAGNARAGSAAGAWQIAGVAAGRRLPAGSAAGVTVWVGASTPSSTGSAAGHTSWTGWALMFAFPLRAGEPVTAGHLRAGQPTGTRD